MKIVISGYYGFNNAGDEAVLEAIILGLKQIDADVRITVLSNSPKETSDTFKVDSANRNSLSAIYKAIRSSDILISGGGGLLQDATGSGSIPYYLGIIKLAQLLRKKTVVFAQGYGPVKNTFLKLLVRRVLNKTALITVRDAESFERLRADGVTNRNTFITADPTFLLSPSAATSNGQTSIKIGVCLRDIPKANINGHSDFSFYNEIAAALENAIEKLGCKVTFIPFHHQGDLTTSQKTAALMLAPSEIITEKLSHRQLIDAIGKMDIVIGMRFHSLVFALLQSKPMIGIDYDPKVNSLMKETGMPIIHMDLSASDITSALEMVIADKTKRQTECNFCLPQSRQKHWKVSCYFLTDSILRQSSHFLELILITSIISAHLKR